MQLSEKLKLFGVNLYSLSNLGIKWFLAIINFSIGRYESSRITSILSSKGSSKLSVELAVQINIDCEKSKG